MAVRSDPAGSAESIFRDTNWVGRTAQANSICCNRLVCNCQENARAFGLAVAARLRQVIMAGGREAGKNLAQLVRDLEAI